MAQDIENGDNARAFLAAIAVSSNDAIIGKDPTGNVTYWNVAAERLFGYLAAEIISLPVNTIIPQHRVVEEESVLKRVRQGERLTHFETERLTKDHRVIPVSLTLSPVLGPRQEVVGISSIVRDLSETQRLNAALLQREALLSSVLNSNPDGLVVINEEGLIEFFSRSAERMFGYDAEEVVGRNVSILMPEPHAGAHDTYIRRYQETREPRIIGIGRVVAARRKDGSSFPADLHIGEAKTEERRFTGYLRDLTDRATHDRRLAELQAELIHVARLSEVGQMTSALAHEVNQPLTAITNYLSGIRRLLGPDTKPYLRQGVDKAVEQAERARGIVQSLHSLVKKEVRPRTVEDLEALTVETAALVLAGGNRRVVLSLDIAPDARKAFIDRVQVQQVLLNLMRNAVEAMEFSAERRLTLRTRTVEGRIEIAIADTGPGLSDEVRARLFQPFTTTKADGLGVGLSICRTIVEAHGGQLSAMANPEHGTTFLFSVAAVTSLAAKEEVG